MFGEGYTWCHPFFLQCKIKIQFASVIMKKEEVHNSENLIWHFDTLLTFLIQNWNLHILTRKAKSFNQLILYNKSYIVLKTILDNFKWLFPEFEYLYCSYIFTITQIKCRICWLSLLTTVKGHKLELHLSEGIWLSLRDNIF